MESYKTLSKKLEEIRKTFEISRDCSSYRLQIRIRALPNMKTINYNVHKSDNYNVQNLCNSYGKTEVGHLNFSFTDVYIDW